MTRPTLHEAAPEAAGRPPEAEALPTTLAQALAELAAVLPALRDAIDRQADARPRIEPLALRLDEVAAALGLSRRAIERERAAGRFVKPDAIVGKMPLFKPETVRRWLDKGGGR